MNPVDLGYYEKMPGSGVWHRTDTRETFEPKFCPSCGNPFMALRRTAIKGKPGGQRFCSRTCAGRTQASADPDYQTRHGRVKRIRGSAKQFLCTDCEGPAREWSQVHDTDGLDVYADYVPRCRPCHVEYDELYGETHGCSRLTEIQVRDILASDTTVAELARLHGTCDSNIRAILQRKTWRRVEMDSGCGG